MKTLEDFDLKDKRVLVRCDFNVPLNERGLISDDFRIKETLPTIKYLIRKGAKIILMSHLGRPDGKTAEKLKLTPIQNRLIEYLGVSITKTQDCLGKETEKLIKKMQPGEIILLENIQFNPGEKENDPNFAKTLANYADIFIMEAFGQTHRNYASIAGIPKYLPSGAGFLLEKEIMVLTNLIEKPEKPMIVIIGGKKAETKVKMINKLSNIADWVLIGGLLKKEIDEKKTELERPEKIIPPAPGEIEGFDVGSKTIEIFKEKIRSAKTILWNGPVGMIEDEKFSYGTKSIALAIIGSSSFSVAGGGETIEFINKIGLTDEFDHLSTGGGAMLAFLSGEELAGIKALDNI